MKKLTMNDKRAKQLLFCALQLLRKREIDHYRESSGAFPDWKDVDDYIFSELDMEKHELEEIYAPYQVLVYSGSCYEDGESPKNFDTKYFNSDMR